MQNICEHADHLRTTPYDDFRPLMVDLFVGGSPEILAAYWDADQSDHEGSVVYFMTRASDEAIKIGYAKTLKNRRRMLEKEHGCSVTVLATRPGGRFLENLYHNLFHDHRFHGEWFVRHPDILAEIERLSKTGRNSAPTLSGPAQRMEVRHGD